MNSLTPAQEKAIEDRKRTFSALHPDAQYKVWQPDGATVLIAFYTAPTMAGTIGNFQSSWTIGKRGKVTYK